MINLSLLQLGLPNQVICVDFIFNHVLAGAQQVVSIRRLHQVLLLEKAHCVVRIQFGTDGFRSELRFGCLFCHQLLLNSIASVCF